MKKWEKIDLSNKKRWRNLFEETKCDEYYYWRITDEAAVGKIKLKKK